MGVVAAVNMAKRLSTQDVLHMLDDSDYSNDKSDSSDSDNDDSDVADVESVSDAGDGSDSDDDNAPAIRTWDPVDADNDNGNHLPTFAGQSRVLVDVTNFEAADFFKLFLDEDVINHIVIQVNLYAEQTISANPKRDKPNSRFHRWHPTNSTEIRKFFGLTFLMGIIKKPKLSMYWSEDPLYTTPIFSEVMSRNRYELILRFLHFNDNRKLPPVSDPDRDRLYKIRPLLDHLFEKFQTVYALSREVSVDESLMLWKGRLLFKQYLPMKRHRFGIKLYKLCESSTGYTYRFQVYAGRDSHFTLPTGVLTPPCALSATENIVWFLMLPLMNKGHHLYCDNFYTSPALFDMLYQLQTPACGTARMNRKDMPKELVKKKQKMGESTFVRRDNLLAVKFTDRKDIHMLSTIHTASCSAVTVRRRSTPTMDKPNCVLEYNKFMGGVDLSDRLTQPYDATRKTLVWYKKLAIYLFQHAMVNAFVLYCQCNLPKAKHDLLRFEHDVISNLLFAEDDLEHGEDRCEAVVRMSGRHFPEKLTANAGKARPTKRCRVCYKKGKRAESRFYCAKCPSHPALCFDGCFVDYHTKIKYWL